jgi:hypothetical protein
MMLLPGVLEHSMAAGHMQILLSSSSSSSASTTAMQPLVATLAAIKQAGGQGHP